MKPLATLLSSVVILALLVPSAQADRKSREEEKAQQQRLERQLRDVEYILKHESDGTLSDRKAALKAMISTGVAPDEAYWQAGYIKKGDQWVSVGDRWLTPEQEQKLEDYNKARSNTIDTDEGHYKLAQWCAENGFDAQAYGHLKAVLLNNPDHAGLRQMLDYQKVGNRWMNAEEYQTAVREADRLAKDMREWGPRLVEIRDGLNSSIPGNPQRAKARLEEITEVAAIPALQLILLPSSPRGAAACVEQLSKIDHRRSSIALCEAVMYLPEHAESVRQTAIDALQGRPLEEFVPALLSQTSTPINYQLRFWISQDYLYFLGKGGVGNPNYPTYAVIQAIGETETLFSNDHYVVNQVFRTRPHELRPNNPTFRQRTLEDGESLQLDFQRATLEFVRATERKMEAIEQSTADRNDRVMNVLKAVTEISGLETPEDWWEWWYQRIEVTVQQKMNRVQAVTEVNETEIPYFLVAASCFTAGTPVWTDRGPQPIEQLKIGDMALTQDVETGELAYRPIIRTTTRKPKPLVTIDLGAEQITSTGGHPFFVSGEGWVRARELKAGQFLHTPTGTIKIDSVTETPEDETFNLVVDGFHTYFVGMSQVLVHDVSITSPTDAIVPGLLDR